MRPTNLVAVVFAALTLIILPALVFSNSASSKKFVISAAAVPRIVVATFGLKPNKQIRMEHFNVIEPEYPDVFNTAVTFRKNKNSVIFDLYYHTEISYDGPTELQMNRLDSSLKLKFAKEFDEIPFSLGIGTARLRKSSGLTHFLVMGSTYRKLDASGNLGPKSVAIRAPVNSFLLDANVAEDGRMFVAVTQNNQSEQFIHVRKRFPARPIRVRQTPDVRLSLALSDPVKIALNANSAGSVAGTYRFLFFRPFQDLEQFQSTQILMQRIDDSTGNFVGPPRTFATTTQNLKTCCVTDKYLQSISVSPGADVVFYTEFDASCAKNVLKGQVFDPQKSTKIGKLQLLIGCSQIPVVSHDGIFGIDVAQFEP